MAACGVRTSFSELSCVPLCLLSILTPEPTMLDPKDSQDTSPVEVVGTEEGRDWRAGTLKTLAVHRMRDPPGGELHSPRNPKEWARGAVEWQD